MATTFRVNRPTEVRSGFRLTAAPEDNGRKVVKILPVGFEFPFQGPAEPTKDQAEAMDKLQGAYLRFQMALADVDLKGFSWYTTGSEQGFAGLTPVTVDGLPYKTVWVEAES